MMENLKEKLIFTLLYRWKYMLAQIRSLFYTKKNDEIRTLTYVAKEIDKEWIFGAIVTRLSKFSSLKSATYFHNKLRNLPDTDSYFFIFPHYFCRAIRHNPKILTKKNIVHFTHENWTSSYSKTHVVWCLNQADYVICLNSDVQNKLVALGVKKEKTSIIHIGSDPSFFYPHERTQGTVGFCSAFGERKNPDLIFDLVKNVPERQFILIGKNWQDYERFETLNSFPNFTYYDNIDYQEYPALYSKIDIFISPSILEGGPVPVLEAMLSNCYPIASRTGFCPDIIEHDVNGFLFNTDASYEEIIPLIDRAANKTNDVRASVLAHSWENCSKKIDQLLQT